MRIKEGLKTTVRTLGYSLMSIGMIGGIIYYVVNEGRDRRFEYQHPETFLYETIDSKIDGERRNISVANSWLKKTSKESTRKELKNAIERKKDKINVYLRELNEIEQIYPNVRDNYRELQRLYSLEDLTFLKSLGLFVGGNLAGVVLCALGGEYKENGN